MSRLRAFGASSRQVLNDWPALVLTAGFATRLQPLSSVRAKAKHPRLECLIDAHAQCHRAAAAVIIGAPLL